MAIDDTPAITNIPICHLTPAADASFSNDKNKNVPLVLQPKQFQLIAFVPVKAKYALISDVGYEKSLPEWSAHSRLPEWIEYITIMHKGLIISGPGYRTSRAIASNQ